jgi:curli biogenesis system outer membrane secretion channel CsgG
MVFERPDLNAVRAEQRISGESNLVGVDALILGSVTEFGRANEAKQGFLSSTRRQVARAAVEIRLVDARTGHVFFTATGRGKATVEDGRVAGFGNRVGYDATLNDRAISAAIADLQTPLMNK